MTLRWLLGLSISLSFATGQPLRPLPENPLYYSLGGKPILIVSSGEHYGAVLNLDFDWNRYLRTLEAEGMNYTRLFSGAYFEPAGAFNIAHNTLAPKPDRLLSPWQRNADGKFDLEQFNPAYFERLKAFMTEAARRRIVVEMTLFSSTYGEPQWKIHPFHPNNNVNRTPAIEFHRIHTLANEGLLDHQLRLVRKIVNELNEFDNLLLEVQNEPWADQGRLAGVVHPYIRPPQRDRWPNSVDAPTAESLAWHARILEEIASAEKSLPKRHMVAVNWSNYRDVIAELPAGASAVHFHYAYPDAVRWNRHLRRPIGCDETGFMGTEDHLYRRQAWEFILSGGALYNHLDYSFSVGKEDGTDRQDAPGGGSPALRRQFAALRRLVEALPFWRMKPDDLVVEAAPGVATTALSLPGSSYVIYGWGAGLKSIALRVPPAAWKVEWMDAEAAQVLPATTAQAPNGSLRMEVPAYRQDFAVRLVRQP